MATLGVVAQMAMDLYYQDYRSDSQFLQIEHFRVQCAMVYAKLLQDEFNQSKLLARQATGFSSVEISPDWLKEIVVTIPEKKCDACNFEICLPEPIFAFSFDAMASGLVLIRPIECKCPEFVKTGVRDDWQLATMPNTGKTFYSLVGRDKIVFKKPTCNLAGSKVSITFIPSISAEDEDAYIPETKELPIINTALQIMLAAKNGNVIDMTNNQNNNTILQTEIDQNSLKNQ